MFKFDEVAPDIAAKMAEWESHRATCTEAVCGVCGKIPPAKVPTPEEREAAALEFWSARAFETLPKAFAGATLDASWLGKLVGAEAVQRARAALDDNRVAFVGPPGSGKTSLAVAMFRALVAETVPITPMFRTARHRYVSAHALAKARAAHKLGDGDAPLVESSMTAPLLLIDELGGEDARYGSAVAEVLYERHAEGLPTWVTTGVDPQAIAQRYGGGIARRVFEGATVFRLGAKK